MARVVSIPLGFVHILDQLRCIREAGIQVDLISSYEPLIEKVKAHTDLPFIPVKIPRDIQFVGDVAATWRLWRVFRVGRYGIVHTSTPKAGVLGMLAAWLARVPVRLHTFTGQRWVTTRGVLRAVLRTCDRLIVKLATRVYADSPSQRDFLIEEQIVRPGKIRVIHQGCLGGINPERFSRRRFIEEAPELASERGIGQDSIKIVFVGRVTCDKGIRELVEAFVSLHEEQPDIELILVGPYEPDLDPLPEATARIIDSHSAIHAVGFCAQPQRFLVLGDIFCIPSYREGFGTVVIEAAAMGLPAVGTRIPGLVDSIDDGQTGILVEPRNVEELKKGLCLLAEDPALRTRMGEAARARARSDFGYRVIADAVIEEYKELAGVGNC